MARISRQRLVTGLSTVLDIAAIALFFIQSAVGDADWIKDEFLDYQFWTSVSDLGILNVAKALVLVAIYSIAAVKHLGPVLIIAIVMNLASLVKIIVFTTHKAKTKTKLPGLHFVLPLFICTICWVQLLLCRFGRTLDHHHLLQETSHDTSSLRNYINIQAEFPASQSVAVGYRRKKTETEPLLPSESLSNSVPIDVLPSVPLYAPTLDRYASQKGLGQNDRPPSGNISKFFKLPPAAEVIVLMRQNLPTKTHIRSLKQIPHAFTMQDVRGWLSLQFSGLEAKRSDLENLMFELIKMGEIELATTPSTKNMSVELESCLFVLKSGR